MVYNKGRLEMETIRCGGVFSLCSRFVLLFRFCNYLSEKKFFFVRFLYFLMVLIYKHYQYKTGIQLPIGTSIGPGLMFPHFGCIIINKDSIIGDNCTIYHGVTVGRSIDGQTPVIGNNCTFFAGAKVFGGIQVGDDAVIGSNAVVTKDVPKGETWVGIPAKCIKK